MEDLTGGTAAAQASDCPAESSLPPSAPAAVISPNGAAPPEVPSTPCKIWVSCDRALVSWDTDMASSAVVAAAGERVSAIFWKDQKRKSRKVKKKNIAPVSVSGKSVEATSLLPQVVRTPVCRLTTDLSVKKSVIQYLLAV